MLMIVSKLANETDTWASEGVSIGMAATGATFATEEDTSVLGVEDSSDMIDNAGLWCRCKSNFKTRKLLGVCGKLFTPGYCTYNGQQITT